MSKRLNKLNKLNLRIADMKGMMIRLCAVLGVEKGGCVPSSLVSCMPVAKTQ